MQSHLAISAKNISKQYSIGNGPDYMNFRDALISAVKQPFPFLKKNTNAFSTYWALKDVNFEISKGEIVGIIGKNGAGKSTLLKILSRITEPTQGEIKLRGRVASLLEVGTGFSGELSGRENIYLNGAILGMTRREITKKFDAIVEFSEVQKFLDTPVKHYSSGMHIRLAFAVAAYLDADILLFDEILSVGDTKFQERCLGKMKEVTNNGRTVVLVSHNIGMIRDYCQKVLLLERSSVAAFGDVTPVINTYLERASTETDGEAKFEIDTNKDISFTRVWIEDKGKISGTICVQDSFTIGTEFVVNRPTNKAEISICISNSKGINVVFTSLSDSNKGVFVTLNKSTYEAKVHIDGNFLIPDTYFIRIIAHYRGIKDIDTREQVLRFTIEETGSVLAPYGITSSHWACVLGGTTWEFTKK